MQFSIKHVFCCFARQICCEMFILHNLPKLNIEKLSREYNQYWNQNVFAK